jgi:predicted PurR-regulated permease PerM
LSDKASSPLVTAPKASRPIFYAVATAALITAILARAQAIVVPLALAVVLSFALGPAVKHLERKLGRVIAVLVVVIVALGTVTAFGYMLERQLVDLSAQMTKYSDSIGRKVRALKGSEGSGLSGLSRSVDKVVRQMDQQTAVNESARSVRLVPADATAVERVESTLAPIVEPLTRSGVVLVLVIFLLLKREDLRDRFIRLVGRGHVTLTTRTLNEAGERISRFLTHQSAINAGFGVLVTAGLLLIGIPYAPLWGFVAAVLRFIPFVGTILAMVLPGALAFAQFQGWWQLGATVGLFLGLDVLAAYVVEPIVIGAKTGVSSMAMLVSAIFWSWLWGPVGLVLSTPMTVCLAVLGKHVPRLSFLAVLLGDEPALEDDLVIYHRLLSGDDEEAQEILDKRFDSAPRAQVFDEVVIPALLLAGRDRARNEITEADHQQVVATIRALLDSVPQTSRNPGPASETVVRRTAPQLVVGVSARAVTDEAIWDMLAQLFDPAAVRVESVGSAYLSSERTTVVEQPPDLVCIISIPPGGLAQARYICRRVRAKLPQTPILVIRPGVQPNGQESAQRLTEDGANQVYFTLADAHRGAAQRLLIRSPAAPHDG